MHHTLPSRQPRIVIAGGGVAALEALLGLRALLGALPQITVLAPHAELTYAPVALAAPFSESPPRRLPLAQIAAAHGVRWLPDALRAVENVSRRIRTSLGEAITYDALLIATGARRRPWLDGAVTIRGPADAAAVRMLLAEVEQGGIDRLLFAAAPGESFAAPLYELALLTASALADRGVRGARLTVHTPERAPLSLFGPHAGEALRLLLADRGIGLVAGERSPLFAERRGALTAPLTLPSRQAITLGRCEGARIAGLPQDEQGFIPVDSHGRVAGIEGVWAAGDATTFPIKQGGLAAQQADAAAESIAAALGAPLQPRPFTPTLRGMLHTGLEPIFMRSELRDGVPATCRVGTEPLWWPPAKIAGTHIGPYLARPAPWLAAATLADLPECAGELRGNIVHDPAPELTLAVARTNGGCPECLASAA